MSFRELRSFTETMRALGYPRPISMENFRTPNFALVAEILDWLVHRYDPHASIPENIETENGRVTFLTTIAAVMATKGRIILKTKNLYAADGRAVKELLKIAKTIYSATRICKDALAKGEDDDTAVTAEGFTFSMKPSDLSALRATASDITERGAKLFDLLKRETEVREARNKALQFLETVSGSLDARAEHEYLERSIRDAISTMKDSIASLESQLQDLVEDEKTLDSKIKKKQAELSRNQKRLESLQTVRPAFMDEYEKLEHELSEEYEGYISRYRNLHFLEHELDEHTKRQKAKVEAANKQLRKLQKKLKDEEFRAFRGDENVGDDEAANINSSKSSGMPPRHAAPARAPAPAPAPARAAGPTSAGSGRSSERPSAASRPARAPVEEEDDDDDLGDDDEDLGDDGDDLGDDDEDLGDDEDDDDGNF